MRKRKNLIFWRIENGLKQVDIIKRLGISSGYYSNLEKGRVNPSFHLLVKFKEVFEIDDILELFKLSKGVGTHGNVDTSRDIDEEQILDR